jgi:endo-1,3(4)-beta-glucanase
LDARLCSYCSLPVFRVFIFYVWYDNQSTGIEERKKRRVEIWGQANSARWYGKVDNDIDVLDKYKDAVPTGADVQAYVTGSTVFEVFKWKTSGSGELPMTALPHHLKVLKNPEICSGISFPVPVGTMEGVIGDTWSMEYKVPNIDFVSPNPISAFMMGKIKAALPRDIDAQEASCKTMTGVYEFSQGLAGIARMALVADEAKDKSLAEKAIDFCKNAIEPWLTGDNSALNTLVYDQTWGGVVTSKGIQHENADFYNVLYNDHHFQYGYLIYTSAVIGKYDPEWLNTNKDAVLNLVRDIAEPSGQDPYFTCLRHKDTFRGNSWANGLFSVANNRNQESSSEAVNAWYAIVLLGSVLEDSEMEDIGKILLVKEILTAREYWQIPYSNINFPKKLVEFGVATNNWSTKIDLGTWFGSELEYCFGIESLPFTPIAGALINPEWPRDHWREIQKRIDSGKLKPEWLEYMYMLLATFSPENAKENMINHPPTVYHNGTSESLTWYFIATHDWT